MLFRYKKLAVDNFSPKIYLCSQYLLSSASINLDMLESFATGYKI